MNMPSDLLDGDDDTIVSQNIRDLRRKGYPESEATAIALRKSREAPRTVKGQDIELFAHDGQAVDTAAQAPFTQTPKPTKKDDAVERVVNKTPFGKAAKALKGS
jgi:uncharacterized protein YdaT